MAVWAALIPVLGSVLDKVLPDPKVAAEAKVKLFEMQQQGALAELESETKLALAQIDVNKAEAESGDWFRGGWRPAVGWVCTFGLTYTYLLRPLLPWTVSLFGGEVPPLPGIESNELYALLFGLLGLGGMRTFERIRGKA